MSKNISFSPAVWEIYLQSPESQTKIVGTLRPNAIFFLLLLPLSLSKLFIAVQSPNLVHQHWGDKETQKCPNNFDWDCSMPKGKERGYGRVGSTNNARGRRKGDAPLLPSPSRAVSFLNSLSFPFEPLHAVIDNQVILKSYSFPFRRF